MSMESLHTNAANAARAPIDPANDSSREFGPNQPDGAASHEESETAEHKSQPLTRIERAPEAAYELILAPARPRPTKGLAYIGAAIGAGMAVGYLLGSGAGLKNGRDNAAQNERTSLVQALPWKSEVTTDAGGVRETARLADEIRSVRTQIEQLRRSADGARAAERLRVLETARDENRDVVKTTAAKIEKLEARLSQLERVSADRTPTGSLQKDRVAKLADEQQRAEPKPASQDQKTAVTPRPISGYVLREVYHGTAIVERRDGLLEEVGRGDELPGAGRVTAIERRGNDWLVVTTKGVIEQRPY
jgi:hypothetical protein